MFGEIRNKLINWVDMRSQPKLHKVQIEQHQKNCLSKTLREFLSILEVFLMNTLKKYQNFVLKYLS